MNIVVLRQSGVPAYKQIYDSVVSEIMRSNIKEDEPLPSIRGLSGELGISVITVKNAFEALEKDGYIYSVQGKGFYVKKRKNSVMTDKQSLGTAKIIETLDYCKRIGITNEEFLKMTEEITALCDLEEKD